MLGDQGVKLRLVVGREFVEADQFRVAPLGEAALFVEDVGNASTHAGREVLSGRAEYHHPSAGHVLAAVVPDALDHRVRAGVADGKALACESAEERPARGRAVQHGVATMTFSSPEKAASGGGSR